MKNLIALVCFFTLVHAVFAQTPIANDSLKIKHLNTLAIPDLEIPKTHSHELIVHHTAYSFVYNEQHEQASWVAYQLTRNETNNLFERNNKFIVDPDVQTQTANDADYKSSGYDRGHLAPAADMGWSEQTMKESFYYSNMSPQVPEFNRGIWKKCEEKVRDWAIEYDSLYIVTGPVLRDSLPSIGANKVSVPEYYYKIVLEYKKQKAKAIAFLMKNEASKEPLQTFVVSIDSVEHVTGIDFFPLLPDEQEMILENIVCVDCWTWETKPSKPNYGPSVNEGIEGKQCLATTKSGKQCKNKAVKGKKYCKTHAKK